ncbi:CaiB/BaiF CoA transferase family protein [Bradyrhizobium manausense]|uniref:CaiB/BaiF CoA transferase family protein n=1 Tax=Bradyrhizobium manausense TaxID=989370 RepID=UPI001BA52349|nr:CoA transferase [Bradyrhizobium manausense]MBR0724239.1 CoA transferase [Bradyrhizobium manausense]
MSEMADNNFSGLNVLEFAQGVAGPYCGMLLAQHGATVTKIEPVKGGDWSRQLGRSYGDFSANSVVVNRGKRSVALDLKAPDAEDIVRRLAAEADVIIENYRPGVIDRLGFGYEAVKAYNEKVIYASLTGFGSVGPNKALPATDTVMQGYCGLMSINRGSDGVPRRLDMLAVDTVAGLYLFQSIAGALYKQLRYGVGSRIETNLLHCALAFQHAKIVEFALSGSTSEAAGSPVGTFRTADGFLSLNARRDPDFRRLCEALGNTWFSDERFASPAARLEHNAELSDLLASIIQKKSTAEWTAALSEADVLHAPVKTYQDLLKDEQVNALGVIGWDELDGLGRHPVVSVPGLATSGERGAPRIGEHNEAVLSDLGYPRSKIDDLRESGAIA